MRFSDKVAIVTGAASGICAAAALRFAKEGAFVVAVDINKDGLSEMTKEAKKNGYSIEARVCDVSSEPDVENAVSLTLSTYGKIDILVNGAGMLLTKRTAETSFREYSRLMDINMGGVFLFVNKVLPQMEKQNFGSIVNVASELAFVGDAEYAAYSATKGAIVSFTRCVAIDAMSYGVRVNCVCPGATDTPLFWEGATGSGERKIILDKFMEGNPLGRLVSAEEVANGITFMASDDASAVIGACLVMDRGYTIM